MAVNDPTQTIIQAGGTPITVTVPPPTVSVPTVQQGSISFGPVEAAALAGKSAGAFVWILVYIVVVALLAAGGYLLVNAVSGHNTQAATWLAAAVIAVFGLFVPSPAGLLRK